MASDCGCRESPLVVKNLPLKPRGRPLLLRQCPRQGSSRLHYCRENYSGHGQYKHCDCSCGGHCVSTRHIETRLDWWSYTTLTKKSGKSLLKRMGYIKRKCSNTSKVSLTQFKKIKEIFLADVTTEVEMDDIPYG